MPISNIRLPRFRRSADSLSAMQITPRDVQIVRHIARHRFLRSTHIIDLVGGSRQQLLRRLQSLYHHGYIDRPRAQIAYFHVNGSHAIVYALGTKGSKLLNALDGNNDSRLDWTSRNQSLKQFYLEHALLTAEVMVALEQACFRHQNLRFLPEEDLIPLTKLHDPFRWTVTIHSKQLGLIPDKVFGLENTQTGERSFFFVEADRSTMPVARRSLNKTSFHRKLLAYEATWTQGLHRSRFGFHRFRVLTVTTSKLRVENLVSDCKKLQHGQGLFLFTDRNAFLQADPLTRVWKTTRDGTLESLVDS